MAWHLSLTFDVPRMHLAPYFVHGESISHFGYFNDLHKISLLEGPPSRRFDTNATMNDASRIWKPLDTSRREIKLEIRLLILAPDRDRHAGPRGKLITVSLEQQLFYEAISHAWSGLSEPNNIHINNTEWPITTEVLMALQQL
ncbi:uncharacterized protein PV07_09430 [Cladophialophora immunda]|uniref:Heterokaryon incompatibility domain-containing protein n=1 Tax=Cladophialophora immunda TaxID=569365 RepID=A0A0D2C746_9EURO|nr:uncharacterized protein PV07_09430 [Cladophialophora immunda]KIW26330.1 hypothetical protein PV07_09430 [Cladophialophora immunda]